MSGKSHVIAPAKLTAMKCEACGDRYLVTAAVAQYIDNGRCNSCNIEIVELHRMMMLERPRILPPPIEPASWPDELYVAELDRGIR